MNQPIKRAGVYWYRTEADTWLRYNEAAAAWEPSASPPPPPPPPPPRIGAPAAMPPAAARTPGRFRSTPIDPKTAALAVGALALVVVLAVIALQLFGGSTPAPPVTVPAALDTRDPMAEMSAKERFIYKADAICVDALKASRDLPRPTSLDELLVVAREADRINHKIFERLGKLDAPRRDRDLWKRKLRESSAVFRHFDDLVAAATRLDVGRVQSEQAAIQKLSTEFNRWATNYGFKVCNRDS